MVNLYSKEQIANIRRRLTQLHDDGVKRLEMAETLNKEGFRNIKGGEIDVNWVQSWCKRFGLCRNNKLKVKRKRLASVVQLKNVQREIAAPQKKVAGSDIDERIALVELVLQSQLDTESKLRIVKSLV